VPDIVNLIIWLVAGLVGGNAAGEVLKEDYDLGPGNTIAGAIGGVVGFNQELACGLVTQPYGRVFS
jgi:uncharacterized membrane protein YeaQ/YmgE (transglycosylase-associated protein family)